MLAGGSSRHLIKAGILFVFLCFLSLPACTPATSCNKVMDGDHSANESSLPPNDCSAGEAMGQNSTFTAGGVQGENSTCTAGPVPSSTYYCYVCNCDFRLWRQLLKHLWCAFTYNYSDHLQITGTPIAVNTPQELIPFIRNLHSMSEIANVGNITDAQRLGVPITSADIFSGPSDRLQQLKIEEAVTWTSSDWRNGLAEPDPLLDGGRRCVGINCRSVKCHKQPTRGASSGASKRKRANKSQANSFFDAADEHDDHDLDFDGTRLDPSSEQLCQVGLLPFMSCSEGLLHCNTNRFHFVSLSCRHATPSKIF
jgi:hypothetical protein